VDDGIVSGWDDPRMPTIAGMRRRGYTPAAIRQFCEMVGTSALRRRGGRGHARARDPRRPQPERAARHVRAAPPAADAAQPAGGHVPLTAPAHPSREDLGTRELPFSAELYIDREDFREEANKKFKRLVLGKRVRLRNAYVIEAVDVEKDAAARSPR
jgi:glutaminyl-tRNA synthetase